MNNRILEKEETLNLLKHINESPDVTQRSISERLNISLGKINFLIKELAKKGLIKIKRASHSSNKLAYIYLLTPEGIRQKSELTKEFLRRKTKEYDLLERQISELKLEVENNSKKQKKERI
ncbi:MAG: MarR family EPS-associated transcriptional regulator [bacterium]